MRKLLWFFLLGFILPSAWADGRGAAGLPWLQIGQGASAIGLGEAGTLLTKDLTAMYYNPAGMEGLESQTIQAGHSIWFTGSNLESISFGYPLQEIGTAGINFSYFWMEPFALVDSAGNPDGQTQVFDMALTLGFAQSLTQLTGLAGLRAGMNLKGLLSGLAGTYAYGGAVDIGMQYKLASMWQIGLSIQNAGWVSAFDQKADPLPILSRLGGRWDYVLNANHALAVLAETVLALYDPTFHAHCGLQYAFKELLILRFGYKIGYDTEGLQAGAGIHWQGYGVDYAVKSMGDFGLTHFFTVSTEFGSTRQERLATHAKERFQTAEKLFEAKRYPEALNLIKDLLLIDPDNQRAKELGQKLESVIQMLDLPVSKSMNTDQPDGSKGQPLTSDQSEELGLPAGGE